MKLHIPLYSCKCSVIPLKRCYSTAVIYKNTMTLFDGVLIIWGKKVIFVHTIHRFVSAPVDLITATLL